MGEVFDYVEGLSSEIEIKKKADQAVEYIKIRISALLTEAAKEDILVYNPASFTIESVSLGLASISKCLSECFELSQSCGIENSLKNIYLEVKIGAVKKKVILDSNRDFISAFHFAVMMWCRELRILQKVGNGVEEDQPVSGFVASTIFEVIDQTKEWLELTEIRKTKAIEEISKKPALLKQAFTVLLSVLEESNIFERMPQEKKSHLKMALVTPLLKISEATDSHIQARYSGDLLEKTKITELDEKFNTIDFIKFFKTIKETSEISLLNGLGLRTVEWAKSTDNFVNEVCSKLNNCLQILEKYFCDQLHEGFQDPFLQVNMISFFKFYSEESHANIRHHVEEQERRTSDMSAFLIGKKLMVSLFEILINKYSQLLFFTHNYIELLQSLFKKHETDGLMTSDLKKMLAVENNSLFIEILRKQIQDSQKKLNQLQSKFRYYIDCLILKDARLLVCKYIQSLIEGKSGTNQILLQIEQSLTQFVYKIDQICTSDQPEIKKSYELRRRTDYGEFGHAAMGENAKYDGVRFWKEEFIACVFSYFFSMSKSVEDRIDFSKLEADLITLKKTFSRFLK